MNVAVVGATGLVGRTMFETDGLPAEWVGRCEALDEIWVPSDFNRETFAAVVRFFRPERQS